MKKQKRISGAYNPVAFALKNGQFKQRIVKSKLKYNRKLKHKGVRRSDAPFFAILALHFDLFLC